ncbi:TonB-dependent receptor [Rapidithrix thailandica]|uniref:TonB-dependent receptor n=1 Tax=Rapidithrix thailandica TaxID=413964 RepID=A0AAW9RZM4_9BACT
MKKLINTLLLVSGFITWGMAQETDSTFYLQEVTVKENRIPPRVSFKNTSIEKEQLRENLTASLGEILALKTPIFIKNYGAGGTATPSFRGTGASHTQVYWNGINLNSPMLGQVDLSLFPVAFTDEIEVNYGAASLLYGTGGLGGAIQMNSKVAWKKQFQLMASQSVNSMENHISNASLTFGNSKLQSTTKAFYKKANNRFDFVNTIQPGQPTWTNKHAQQQQHGFLQELSAKLGKKQTLGIKAWYQQSKRDLAPSMDKKEEFAWQGDESLRLLAEWQLNDSKKNLSLKGAYIHDKLEYEKELNNAAQPKTSYSLSNGHIYKLNGIANFKISNQLYLNSGFKWDYDEISSTSYKDLDSGEKTNAHQNTFDLYTSAEWLPVPSLSISLLFRQQWLDSERKPFLPSLGMKYALWTNATFILSAKANLSRNFHAPTLNDRYWYPVGNPQLKPEEGWTGEGGLQLQTASTHRPWHASYELTAFNSVIHNWIIWKPAISNLWRPENLREVHSQGIEQVLKIRYQQNNWRLDFFASASVVKSENQKPYDDLDDSVDKQLLYTPVSSFQGYIKVKHKQNTLIAEQTAYGKRYTQNDGSEWLNPYYLTNLVYGREFSLGKHLLSLQARINNLFGYHYQSIARKPMPNRVYQLRLTFHMNE